MRALLRLHTDLCILLSTLFTIQEVVESLIYGTPTVIFEQ
jgi:hypothetical protein